jgi:oligosaccharide repeat unit polymerase
MEIIAGFGSPVAVTVWLIACATTIWWLVRQGRQQTLVTIPGFVVVFWFLLPILLQYPFTFSPANAIATGFSAFEAYQGQVDGALFISVIGMAAFAASFIVLRKAPRPNAPTIFIARALSAWSHPGLLWGSALLVIGLFIFLSASGLVGPEGMRNRAMEMPALRPIYNVVATVLPLLVAIVLLAAVERRNVVLGVLASLLLLPALLTGVRGVAFGGIMSYGLTVLGYKSLRQELPARRLFAFLPLAAVVLFLALYLGDVRAGQYNILATAAKAGVDLFYGNNFSDLRDFAWVLAYWDGDWFGGRTQLAGVLGFVPAVLSPFRTYWGWGRVSTDMVGLSLREVDTTHGGLRPGAFGELYLNFGLAGVILGGLLLGYFTVRLYAATRDAVERYSPFEAKLVILAAFTALGLLFNFYVTAGFFGVYVVLGVLTAVRIVKGVVRASARPYTGAVAPVTPMTAR